MTAASEVRPTDRWRGLGGAVLLAAAFGVLTRTPALLVGSAAGVALLGYERVVSPPSLTLSATRTVEPADSDASDRVTVTLAVENVGERTIPALRLVDGVPETCVVVDGDAGLGTALRPGATATLTYDIEGGYGHQSFDPVTVVVSDVAGVVERHGTVTAAGAEAVGEKPGLTEGVAPSLPTANAQYAGQHTTDRAGSGTVFRSVREYQPGDPVSRIDWGRKAKTGDLATVEFHREQSMPVVLVVDARPEARLAPSPTGRTAIEHALAAATTLFGGLTRAGHRVGLARLGDGAWVDPDRGPAHRRRVRDLLASPPDPEARTNADSREWLAERLTPTATVVLLTPACDDGIVDLARRLDVAGTPVTVCSPDPTATATAGQRLARLERDRRLRRLRAAGTTVLDWDTGDDIERLLTTTGWDA